MRLVTGFEYFDQTRRSVGQLGFVSRYARILPFSPAATSTPHHELRPDVKAIVNLHCIRLGAVVDGRTVAVQRRIGAFHEDQVTYFDDGNRRRPGRARATRGGV